MAGQERCLASSRCIDLKFLFSFGVIAPKRFPISFVCLYHKHGRHTMVISVSQGCLQVINILTSVKNSTAGCSQFCV